jgi:hypothetical protein
VSLAAETESSGSTLDLDELESRLLWIFGSPRSGSTWMLEQLCDPLVLTDREGCGFSLGHGERSCEPAVLPVNEFLISMHLAPPGQLAADAAPPVKPVNECFAEESGYLFAREFEQVWRPAVRRFVLARLAAVEAAAGDGGMVEAGNPVVAIKEVTGSHAADLVMSLFPRSRLLFLVRDGRDVLDSRLDAVSTGGWMTRRGGRRGVRSEEERDSFMRRALGEWVKGIDATRRAYDAMPAAARRMIRYEDLIADPAGTLTATFEWLGVPRSDERIADIVAGHAFAAAAERERGPGRRRRAARPGLWRENLSEAELVVVDELIGERLEGLGYQP